MSCANIGTFLVLTKQKAGYEYDRLIIFTSKRKLVTLHLRGENVSNNLNISRTKKNVVTTL